MPALQTSFPIANDPAPPRTPKGRPVGKEFIYLRPDVIAVEEGENVRFELPRLEELMSSIQEFGIQVPLHVRAEGTLYVVVAGHRRLAAVKLGIERGLVSPHFASLPCRLVTPVASAADELLLQLVRNNSEPLTPLEQAGALDKLEKLNTPRAEILSKWGVSETYLARLQKLRDAPDVIQEWIRAGRMTAKTGLWVMQHFKPQEREAALFDAARQAKEANSPRIMPAHFQRETVEMRTAETTALNAKRFHRLVRQCESALAKCGGSDAEDRRKRKLIRTIDGLLQGRRSLEEVLCMLA